MVLVNIMEKLVENKMELYMKQMECCNCEHCYIDIKCLALNKLPPKYVSTRKGELFSRVDQMMAQQNKVDVDMAVLQAIEFVKSHPQHDKVDD